MTRAYYNEIDPEAVACLRELVACGVIAPGDVDGRSIKDVTANDIRGYTQCHFFAGAGLWSAGARIAGWPDSRSLWSASCPCQGESLAVKRLGADDPRHLWPDLFRLIRSERPLVIVGEQVAAAAGTHWLDGTCSDLESEDYAARAVDIPACAVDAPHIRQRIYWVALADAEEQRRGSGLREGGAIGYGAVPANGHGSDRVLAYRDGQGKPQRQGDVVQERRRPDHGHEQGFMGDAIGSRLEGQFRDVFGAPQGWRIQDRPFAQADGRNGSWWDDAEWLACHDDKARRAKPGTPMLVDGMAGRASVWRLAGNSIVPQLAAEVIASILETEGVAA